MIPPRESLETLARTIRERVTAPVRSAATPADLAAATSACVTLAEEFLAAHQKPPERTAIACGPGCGTCCALYVSILFPEGAAIALYLREALPPADFTRARSRLDDLCRELQGLDAAENPVMPRSCPFLDRHGSCAIYPVRPLLCRAVTSTDPESCRGAIAGNSFGETPQIVMNLFQKEVMETVFEELGRVVDRSGRDGRSFVLPLLVQRILKNPQVVERWMEGERLSLS